MTRVQHNQPRSQGLAVFDVCDTLYRANTTLGFLRFVHGKDLRFKGMQYLLGSRFSPVFYIAAASLRLLGRDVARAWMVHILKGSSRTTLLEAASAYVREALAPLANAEVMARLEQHKQAGDRVVLVSSSLDIVVGAIAQHLGTDFRASRLGFNGDRCTGRIEHDLTGGKDAIVRNLRSTDSIPLYVYTDNETDRCLLRLADKATIIIPAGRSARWAKEEDCDLLTL